VVDHLVKELPNLSCFATLSPIPGLVQWIEAELAAGNDLLLPTEAAELGEAVGMADGQAALAGLLEQADWASDPAQAEALRGPLLRLAARYLLSEKRGRRALDRVAHFHLANGARVERLNWLADTSAKGMRQAAGLMVNYRYKLDEIEQNHEVYTGEGRVVAHAAVRRLLKG
jgi:malonyl-CoA decarboxylase